MACVSGVGAVWGAAVRLGMLECEWGAVWVD